ncbi:MAG: TetR/AcrR family transcriptional regulator [Bryobacteraceae bacterium]
MIDTKQRILDTAERLFGEQGYDAISLRHIIGEAGVNLAAVHYHFGSKEDLLDEVVVRKLGPVNEARLALLDQAEKEAAGAPVPVERILRAFLTPTETAARQNPEFVKVMGRIVAEGLIERIAQRHFRPMIDRFVEVLQRSLPDLSKEELGWRIYFMFGAISRALCGESQTWLTGEPGDFEERIEKLIAFLSGAFQAPPAARQGTPKVENAVEQVVEPFEVNQ